MEEAKNNEVSQSSWAIAYEAERGQLHRDIAYYFKDVYNPTATLEQLRKIAEILELN